MLPGPEAVRYRRSRGLKTPAWLVDARACAWPPGLQQGLADRLGIDLEFLADRGTGASRGVRGDGSFDVVRGQHPPSPGHLVAFEEGQDGGPVNRVLAGQGECRRSGQVARLRAPRFPRVGSGAGSVSSRQAEPDGT